jgi:hypothetical protein
MLQYSVVFYLCLHHSIINLADEMFYKQNDIEPVPFGCQLQSLPWLMKSSNSANNFTESTTFHSI